MTRSMFSNCSKDRKAGKPTSRRCWLRALAKESEREDLRRYDGSDERLAQHARFREALPWRSREVMFLNNFQI